MKGNKTHEDKFSPPKYWIFKSESKEIKCLIWSSSDRLSTWYAIVAFEKIWSEQSVNFPLNRYTYESSYSLYWILLSYHFRKILLRNLPSPLRFKRISKLDSLIYPNFKNRPLFVLDFGALIEIDYQVAPRFLWFSFWDYSAM